MAETLYTKYSAANLAKPVLGKATDYTIVSVVVGTKIVKLTGNVSANFAPGDFLGIHGNTDNDGSWTIDTVTFNTPNTDIKLIASPAGTATNGIAYWTANHASGDTVHIDHDITAQAGLTVDQLYIAAGITLTSTAAVSAAGTHATTPILGTLDATGYDVTFGDMTDSFTDGGVVNAANLTVGAIGATFAKTAADINASGNIITGAITTYFAEHSTVDAVDITTGDVAYFAINASTVTANDITTGTISRVHHNGHVTNHQLQSIT